MRLLFFGLFVLFIHGPSTVSAAGGQYDQVRSLFINAWANDPCIFTAFFAKAANGEDMGVFAQRSCSAALDAFLGLSRQEKLSCIRAHTPACHEFLNVENKIIRLCAFECQQGRRTLETLADFVVNKDQFLAFEMEKKQLQAEQFQQSQQLQQSARTSTWRQPLPRPTVAPRATSSSPTARRSHRPTVPRSKSLSPPRNKPKSKPTTRPSFKSPLATSLKRSWNSFSRRSP